MKMFTTDKIVISMFRKHFKCFTSINAVNSHKTPVRWMGLLLQPPFTNEKMETLRGQITFSRLHS